VCGDGELRAGLRARGHRVARFKPQAGRNASLRQWLLEDALQRIFQADLDVPGLERNGATAVSAAAYRLDYALGEREAKG
jgi:hypothetical protein